MTTVAESRKTFVPGMGVEWLLPAVMIGGSLLLRRLTLGEATPFQATWIRALHAHGSRPEPAA